MGVYLKGVNKEWADRVLTVAGYRQFFKDDEIVEVKEPHGRLIDADVIDGRVSVREDGFKGETHDVLTQVRGLIATTPTVIEAEGEE